MISKKNFLYIVMIIIIVAIGVQLFRSGVFEIKFKVDQNRYKTYTERFSPSEEPIEEYQNILCIYSLQDIGDERLYNNTKNTFDMAKLNYSMELVSSNKLNEKIDKLDSEDLLVIATEKLNELKDYNKITSFINNGGKVVFLVRSYFEPFDDVIGIEENRGFYNDILYGFKFKKMIFPGLDSMKIDSKMIPNSSLNVSLKKDVEVLATAENTPIIWTRKYGDGELLYVNSTLMMDKVNRGLLLQYITYLPEFFITTIFNGKIVNIDDFPAPIRRGKTDIIYDEYKLKNRRFYRQVWWSTMYNLARRYDLKYTGLIIGTYNDNTKPPFPDLDERELEDIKYFGRKLSEIDGELGIHGYNHNSLALRGQADFNKYEYNHWESKKAMEEGLNILKTNINKIYGNIKIYTYVPTSNIISRDGKQAVKAVFEDIKIFAGLYTGLPEKGVLYQEFGKDPDVDGVYCFPRFSSGYMYNKDVMWSIYNAIAHYGLVNHFVHPDDILDPTRSNGKSWSKFENNINSIFKDIHSNFSFLRPMTNIEAYEEYIKNENLRVYTSKKNNSIIINYQEGSKPVYNILRLKNDNRILRVKGGEFHQIDSKRNLYLIEGNESIVKIRFK